VVQLTDGEAGEIAALLGRQTRDAPALLAALAYETGARAMCVTRGADGAVLLLDGRFVDGRPPPVVPVDTVGAGDAFAATLLDGILAALQSEVILQRAIALGALVATRRGATPAWKAEELQAILDVTPKPSSS
jgi:fructokinase